MGTIIGKTVISFNVIWYLKALVAIGLTIFIDSKPFN